MPNGALSPRGGYPVTDPNELRHLASHSHLVDDYGIDNVSICLVTLKSDPDTYILTRGASEYWAWRYQDKAQGQAAFRYFRAASYADWGYCPVSLENLPLVAADGFSSDIAPWRIYRSSDGLKSKATPFVVRFPWPSDRQIDEAFAARVDQDGYVHHNVWLTSTSPLSQEMDLQVNDHWVALEAVAHLLDVAATLPVPPPDLEEALGI